MKLTTIVNWLTQPSTISGLIFVVSMFGVHQAEAWVSNVSSIVAAAAGIYEVMRHEKP